jgi:hypothetical protein
LAFAGDFLELSGLFQRWDKRFPLAYTSPNAPEVRDERAGRLATVDS